MKCLTTYLTLLMFLSNWHGNAKVRYQRQPDGVIVSTKDCATRLQVFDDKIIRVSVSPDGEFTESPSLAVLPSACTPEFTLQVKADNLTLATTAIKAVVNGVTGIVKFYVTTGKLLLQEDDKRDFTPINVEGTDAYSVTQRFVSLDDREGLYGLGQHQSNEFNYKGKNEELFQYNTKVSVPFIVSTNNYGILQGERRGRQDGWRV